jgi:GT2 family glycosyltransferase
MPNDLFVVIPTAGAAARLPRTLDSLAACRRPTSYRETIVVENGPKGDVEAMVQAAPPTLRARYLHREEANKSRALNFVFEQLTSGLVFLTDDDVRLAPETLAAYAKAAEGIQRGVVFGGPLGIDYETPPPEWLRCRLPNGYRGWSLEENRRGEGETIFLGANWAVFVSDVLEAGGFDPHRGPGSSTVGPGQETEMQQRLYGRGLKAVYVSEAMVWHYVPAERCSPRWALKRARRAGIEFGLDHADPAAWQGVPRWVWRQWLEHAGKWAATRLHPNQPVRFAAAHALARWGGVIRGCRLARHQKREGNNA